MEQSPSSNPFRKTPQWLVVHGRDGYADEGPGESSPLLTEVTQQSLS